MRFRLLTLLLLVTATCLGLSLITLAAEIPTGGVVAVGMPIGLSVALATPAFRRTNFANRMVIAGLFTIGWCFLTAYVEVLLAAFRPAQAEVGGLDKAALTVGLGVFAAPACVVGVLLLRAWLWSWHDQFDKV